MNAQMDHPLPPSQSQETSWRQRASGSIGRHRRLAMLLLVVVLVGVGIYYVLRPSTTSQMAGGRFGGNGPMPVNVAKAEKGEIPITVNALGTIVPLSTVTVRPQVSGYILQIAFQEGQMVKQGDVLAVIDPKPFQLALQQSEGQLERDEALLKNAQIDAARYKTLFEQDSIAKQQLDTQDALVRQYRGTVQTDQAQVDNAKLNLSYSSVKAPQTGRIGLRTIDQGNYVSAGESGGIATITQLQPISALFTVPEDSLQSVMKRVRSGATLTVVAYDRSQKTKLAVGNLTTVDNQIDTTTGTVKMRAQFPNADESLFPNQFVNVELLVDTLKDVVTVPIAAVQRGAPGTFVYVVGAEDKVAVKVVKVGASTADRVAIESGIEPGDVVVIDGADRIRDGAPVLLPGKQPPAAGARPAGARTGKRPNGADGRPAGGPPGGRPPGMGGGGGGMAAVALHDRS